MAENKETSILEYFRNRKFESGLCILIVLNRILFKGHSLHTRKIKFSQKKKWMEKILDIKIMQEEVFPKKPEV